MPRLLVIVILLLATLYISSAQEKQEAFNGIPLAIDTALTAKMPNAKAYRTAEGAVVFKLRMLQGEPLGRVLFFEKGTGYDGKGALVFQDLTVEEIEYLLAKIELFRTQKKIKE